MSKPTSLQSEFDLGFKRDQGRQSVPRGAVWAINDYLPGLEAECAKRGGWLYHGSALNDLDSGALEGPAGVFVAPFKTGTKVLATATVDQPPTDQDQPNIFDLTASADRGPLYSAGVGSGIQAKTVRGIFYKDLMIFSAASSTIGPRKLNSAGAIAALGGSPPHARGFAIYKNFLAAAGDFAATSAKDDDYVYWAVGDNPESWDLSLRATKTSGLIRGMAGLPNAMLVFHDGSVERIRGDFPPGTSASNMILEPLFTDVGVHNPGTQAAGYTNALAALGDICVWADREGVYSSDGATISDLTKQGGLSHYWRESVYKLGAHIAVGIWRGFAWVSVLGLADEYTTFLLCELRTRSWFRFENVTAYNFATQYGATDEMYFSNRDTSQKKVGKLSQIFVPAETNMADANGVSVLPSFETGYYTQKEWVRKRLGRVYITYGLQEDEDPGIDDPQLVVSVAYDPEASSYTQIGILPKTSTASSGLPDIRRRRLPLHRSAPGFALKIDQTPGISTGRSIKTVIYGIDAEIESREGSQVY